ncbi:MAG: hypothetical protein EZS28_047961, partial [Streblomastix strix]
MTVCGTEYYLSPELTTEGFQSFEADVWGIGLIIHEILTQMRPFDSKAPLELMTKRINNQVQAQIDPRRYSPELIKLVDSMHLADRTQRPTIPQILDHPRIKPFQQQSQQSQFQPNREMLSTHVQLVADELAAASQIQQQHFMELQSKISQHQLLQASPMLQWVNDPYRGQYQIVQQSLLIIPSPLANRYRSIHLAVPSGND